MVSGKHWSKKTEWQLIKILHITKQLSWVNKCAISGEINKWMNAFTSEWDYICYTYVVYGQIVCTIYDFKA